MSDIAIRAEGLGKRYRIGTADRQHHLREVLVDLARTTVRRARRDTGSERDDEIWALRNVSFEVRQGEVVGFVGRNGAGKSTLLKILARITEPTEGFAVLHGRIGSLLEVGTGFHTDLTGRENVYMNGAILGMARAEIRRKFDQIVAFAEVERFIDTPVKHYSSGMYMRLGFAVAAHLDPEILLVDEALAVGDAAFQAKCLGKMEDIAHSGRTVIFVSHNMAAVQSLCDRVIWLDAGTVASEGEPAPVIAGYLKTSYTTVTEQVWEVPTLAPGTDDVRIHAARVRPAGGTPGDPISIRTSFEIEIQYWNRKHGARLGLSVQLLNEHGVVVFDARPVLEPEWQGRAFPMGMFRDTFQVPADLLNSGRHRVEVQFLQDKATLLYHHPELLIFDVDDALDRRGEWWGKWPGAVRPLFPWRTELLLPDGDPASDLLPSLPDRSNLNLN